MRDRHKLVSLIMPLTNLFNALLRDHIASPHAPHPEA